MKKLKYNADFCEKGDKVCALNCYFICNKKKFKNKLLKIKHSSKSFRSIETILAKVLTSLNKFLQQIKLVNINVKKKMN